MGEKRHCSSNLTRNVEVNASTFLGLVSNSVVMQLSSLNPRTKATLIACWVASCSFGTLALWQYEATPGTIGTVPRHWPTDSLLLRSNHQSELLMFAHPHCPCTRASLDELAIVLTSPPEHRRVRIVFAVPQNASPDWFDTPIVHQAQSLQDVTVVFDEGGRLSAQFGAQTSGSTLLYGADGELRFSGGITGLRGHAGANMGRVAVTVQSHNAAEPPRKAAVFGCALVGAEHRLCPVKSGETR